MGDPVRVVRTSPGRPGTGGIVVAWALAVGALLAALAMLAPAAGAAAAQQQGQGTTVSIQDFFFSPAQITVQPGTTVTWMNNGQAPHTVTADDGSFDSETLQPGQSFSFTFANAGTFSYFCEIHPFMTGSVTVVGGGGGDGSGGGGATPQASAQTGSVTATAQQASAKATAGGRHMLPQTGGLPPLLPTVSLLLGCGALGGGALWRRARRTTATKGDV